MRTHRYGSQPAPLLPLALAAVGLLAPRARAADFAGGVRPILAAKCFRCHGPEVQKGRLRLDVKARALRGGLSGPAIVPGRSDESLAYRYVAGLDPDVRMPPSGGPLPAADVAALKAWIDEGAPWPEGLDPPDAAEAPVPWSFEPIRRPAPPEVRSCGWPRGPIDRFVLARLEPAGLDPSPEADRAIWIRRLTLDLHGLLPTPEEVAELLRDDSPDACERLVDRLLASPRHGERWARHWLDVVRFAETHGFEMNQPRESAWPYRDYVICALNEDRPYDRFVQEQLAGDLVGEDAATGFIVGGAWDQVKSPDPGLTAEQRMNELHDMASTTGTAFLGLTVGCARCHHHKFDPVSQRDYYGLQAVFAGVEHGEREVSVPDGAEREARGRALGALEAELARLRADLWKLEPQASLDASSAPSRPPVSPLGNTDRFAAIEARLVRFTVLKTSSLEPCLDELEVFTASDPPRNAALASAGAKARSSSDFPGSPLHKLEHLNDGLYGNGRSWISAEPGRGWVEVELLEPVAIDRVLWARDREGKYQDRLALEYRIEVAREPGAWKVVATSADRLLPGANAAPAPGPASGPAARARELELEVARLRARPKAYAGRFVQPGPTHRLHRGEPAQVREAVAPGAIAALGEPLGLRADAPEGERRMALARWIAHPRNPLAARVISNRLWQHHLGEGIVATPDDFGSNGAPPSNPEFLDWLASELVARGWSLKALHREVVLSSAYRQSSAPRPEAVAVDASSRLLWRFPPRRVEAELIRDCMLQASGALDLRMGGPGFSAFEPNDNYVRVYEPKRAFGPADWRRMVYMTKVRMQQDGTFGAFDCPDAGQACPRRTRSTTALQSLSLFNSAFVLEQARLLAARLEREAGAETRGQVRRAFALLLQRAPDPVEEAAAADLVAAHGLEALCRALFNSSELLFVS
ncbi:MAG: PSD1 domain-containing protein [Planctomycetes bacterium]|nr:PSD1 domain-containing protein [Planctomycetota bacterium]